LQQTAWRGDEPVRASVRALAVSLDNRPQRTRRGRRFCPIAGGRPSTRLRVRAPERLITTRAVMQVGRGVAEPGADNFCASACGGEAARRPRRQRAARSSARRIRGPRRASRARALRTSTQWEANGAQQANQASPSLGVRGVAPVVRGGFRRESGAAPARVLAFFMPEPPPAT
jgi:hypothetical protein